MASDTVTFRTKQPPPSAAEVEIVLGFANTHADRFGRSERFADADGLSDWLAEHGFAEAAADVTDADAGAVRELRDALVAILLGHSDDPHSSAKTLVEAEGLLRRTGGRYPLVTVVDRSGAHLVPAQRGLPGALGSVLAAMTELALTGAWNRCKACRNQRCHFAFYDRSRNTSGAYCSSTCSTQVGMRNYRQRRNTTAASHQQTANDCHQSGAGTSARFK
ncbi:CGNR zinc finger domain-containing protein [Kribbella qitaiheensis]|uniref:CGNR zinc finger domain-containing protein n=1 Tax=Kribbella qitaiheensis TaxID=1544730 RepID=UPI003609CDCD